MPLNDCAMCEHPNFTWYEVLAEDCGKRQIPESVKALCDIHQQIFMEQMTAKTGVD